MFELARVPLFDRLADARSVLIAGAGGGFDVFSGLPLYFALRRAGKAVHLANLTFSWFAKISGPKLTPHVVEVTADSTGPDGYFPEKHLAAWFRSRGEEVPIHTLQKVGVRPLRAAYAALCEHLGVDAVILADGGTDSLLRGDEGSLGTPAEDMSSIAAVHGLALPTKLLTSVGFGIDAFHGVCHAHVLESIAGLTKAGGYLGAFSLLPETDEVALYRSAVEAVHAAMPEHPSIVNASILSAVEGDFGDVHRTERTRGSRLFINPLMGLVFAFELDAVAQRVMYLPALERTETMFEVSAVIEAAQRGLDELRPWKPIPV
jgi:hypothetical protein